MAFVVDGREVVPAVLGRFIDGRFVEDGQPASPPPEPAPGRPTQGRGEFRPPPAVDPTSALYDYLREAAAFLERANVASHAYLEAWGAQLERAGARGPGREPTRR